MDTVFFVLSKVLAPVLAPETWVFLLGTVALLLLWRRRSGAAAIALASMLLLYVTIAVLPLGRLILNGLEQRYPPNPAVAAPAGMIVLGGGEDTARSAAAGRPVVNEAGDRFLEALSLAHQFEDATVLFTGGIGRLDQSGPSGADIAEAILLRSGIAEDRLILERDSRNTAENARLSLALRPETAGPWFLVTSAFHMPRSLATFCAAGWTDLVPWPTDYRGGAFADGIGWDFSANAAELELGLREVAGGLAYRLTGRAVAEIPDRCLNSAPFGG